MIATVLAAAALLTAPAVPASAVPARTGTGAELHASRSTGLTEGVQITVTGTGFRPGLKSVAVGLCREGYANGLKDCDLGGGATFVNIDAKGGFPAVRLTVHAKFKGIDCMTRQCVIGAGPLPGTVPPAVVASNSAVLRVGFQGSPFTGGTAVRTSAAPAASGPGTGGPSTVLWAVTAALLVLAGAAVATVQRRRR